MGDFGIPGARQPWSQHEIQLLVEAVQNVQQVPNQDTNAANVHGYLTNHHDGWTRTVHGIKYKIQAALVQAGLNDQAEVAQANVAAAIQQFELTALRFRLLEMEQQLAEAEGQNDELQQQADGLRAEMDQMETFYARWQDDVVAHVQGVLYDGAVALAERARQLPALLRDVPRARPALPAP